MMVEKATGVEGREDASRCNAASEARAAELSDEEVVTPVRLEVAPEHFERVPANGEGPVSLSPTPDAPRLKARPVTIVSNGSNAIAQGFSVTKAAERLRRQVVRGVSELVVASGFAVRQATAGEVHGGLQKYEAPSQVSVGAADEAKKLTQPELSE